MPEKKECCDSLDFWKPAFVCEIVYDDLTCSIKALLKTDPRLWLLVDVDKRLVFPMLKAV